jgi:hypothetical protein
MKLRVESIGHLRLSDVSKGYGTSRVMFPASTASLVFSTRSDSYRKRQRPSARELTTRTISHETHPNSRGRILNNHSRNYNLDHSLNSSRINYKPHRNHNLNVDQC